MSTGLTYVNITDTNTSSPLANGTYTFSSYDEAMGFGEWYCRAINDLYGSSQEVYVFIYTTGPNNNGWWNGTIATPAFVPFD